MTIKKMLTPFLIAGFVLQPEVTLLLKQMNRMMK
jgi:hypothetical protein